MAQGFGSVDIQMPYAGQVQRGKEQKEGDPELPAQKPAGWLGKNAKCVLVPKRAQETC